MSQKHNLVPNQIRYIDTSREHHSRSARQNTEHISRVQHWSRASRIFLWRLEFYVDSVIIERIVVRLICTTPPQCTIHFVTETTYSNLLQTIAGLNGG